MFGDHSAGSLASSGRRATCRASAPAMAMQELVAIKPTYDLTNFVGMNQNTGIA